MNWKEVISCLDHPGFLISTVEALRLIVTACHKGLQEPFPIELLYRSWSNTEGQVGCSKRLTRAAQSYTQFTAWSNLPSSGVHIAQEVKPSERIVFIVC